MNVASFLCRSDEHLSVLSLWELTLFDLYLV